MPITNLDNEKDPRVGPRRNWAADGIRVWAQVDFSEKDGKRAEVWSVCDVTCAAGNLARVKSLKTGKERWQDVTDLYDYISPKKETADEPAAAV